jgi:hypothetical protein
MRLHRALKKGLKSYKLPNYKLSAVLEYLYLSDRLDWVFNSYYSVRAFVKNVIKVIRFIPTVWKFQTWDYAYVLRFNYKLHKELYRGLYEEGHHLPCPKQKRALKTIIELYRRLAEEDYHEPQRKYLDKLYGPENIYFKTVAGSKDKPFGPYSTMESSREDNMTPEELNRYRKLFNQLYKHSKYLKKQDYELLGKLIAKHGDIFWD